MSKKLTKADIDARMEAYEEAAGHLELVRSNDDTEEEKRQIDFVVKQIRAIANKWYEKVFH